jgi:nicotinate-nucleotide adenylyltransferase
LDKLWVMPAANPPHKPWRVLTSDEHRLELCRLAFAGEEKIEVSDYEILAGGTSYTYLTLRHFKKLYPAAEFYFLVGTDMLRNFPLWKNPEEILENCTLAVCARAEDEDWASREQTEFFNRFGKNFVVLSYEGKDVSSTKIRVLAGAGMRLNEYVPLSVEEYIQENGLYSIPFAKEALSLETPRRQAHSLRVATLAAKRAVQLQIPEKKAIEAALLHDCAKNLEVTAPQLDGFALPTEWGEVPKEVAHQFAGAYVCERIFGITDEEVLNAIRYHTSGRPNMGQLEKLVFLADMLEEERNYDCVEKLRALFWKDMDECLKTALFETLRFLEKKGGGVYPLTRLAYEFYANK